MLKDSHRRPMPDALRQRLRDIPRHEVLCRDVDRLYRAARSQVDFGQVNFGQANAGQDAESASHAPARQHLRECSRCNELYTTVSSAFASQPLPLPRRLARNLRSIARHPERLVPIWIADTRYAAAACYLLAALTLSLAGDASALFRDTTTTVSSKAQVWVDQGEAQGLKTWTAATTTLGSEVDKGLSEAVRYRTLCETFAANTFKTLKTQILELIPGHEPVEGDPDGQFRNNGK